MTEEEDKKLVQAFPLLYRDRYASMNSTAMCWGFEVKSGWFQLIWDLSSKLEPLIQKWIEENPNEEYHPCASQVKEKYGTLRFYTTFGTDEMWNLITDAEDRSGQICEQCGNSGKMAIYHAWLYTTCSKCFKPGSQWYEEWEKENETKSDSK